MFINGSALWAITAKVVGARWELLSVYHWSFELECVVVYACYRHKLHQRGWQVLVNALNAFLKY